MIAAIQLPAIPKGDDADAVRESNLQAAVDWLGQAGENGVDIACLGEGFNLRGVASEHIDLASNVQGDFQTVLARLGEVARRYQMYIIAPIFGILDGKLRDLAMVIAREGQYLGSYLKVHCTQDERKLGIEPGGDWPIFELDFGRIGIQICHDNAFPESARILALKGAEVIFWPHMMSGWGEGYMEVLLRGPAVYNGVTAVPVCFGYDPGIAWRPGQMLIGRSSIIRPDATVVADAGRQVGMAIGRVDLDLPRVAYDFTRQGDHPWQADMLRDRRPETYAFITEPVRLPRPGGKQPATHESKRGRTS
jgi:predicted amidohydrolase